MLVGMRKTTGMPVYRKNGERRNARGTLSPEPPGIYRLDVQCCTGLKRQAGLDSPAVQLRTPSGARVASQHCSILRMGRGNLRHLYSMFKGIYRKNLIRHPPEK